MPDTNFFWDPLSDNILQERDETGAVTAAYTTEPGQYGNLISQNRGGIESQYHFDALGSTLALTDDNQQVTDTYAYSGFGELAEQSGTTVNPFQFVGQKQYYKQDVSGGWYVRARPLMPAHGRWQSKDRIQSELSYGYAWNQPTVQSDPSGLIAILPESAPRDEDLRCGDTVAVRWKFFLDKEAPCDGYMVQQVLYLCRRQPDCAKCPLTSDSDLPYSLKAYWEAWKVEKGSTSPAEPFTHTDAPSAHASDLMCGEVFSIGIVRFFCKEDFGGTRGTGDLDSLWAPKNKKYGAPPCVVTANDIVSIGPPPPSWWYTPAVEGPAVNMFGIRWDCCPCPKKHPIELFVSP